MEQKDRKDGLSILDKLADEISAGKVLNDVDSVIEFVEQFPVGDVDEAVLKLEQLITVRKSGWRTKSAARLQDCNWIVLEDHIQCVLADFRATARDVSGWEQVVSWLKSINEMRKSGGGYIL